MTILESIGVALFMMLVVFAVLILLYLFIHLLNLILDRPDRARDAGDRIDRGME